MKSLPDKRVAKVVELTFKYLEKARFGPILSNVPLDASQRGIDFHTFPPHEIAHMIAADARKCGARSFARLGVPHPYPSRAFSDRKSRFCMRVISFYSVELGKVMTRADWAFIQ